MRLVPDSERCPPEQSDICQRWSRGHPGPEIIPSRPAGHSPPLLVGWGCSSLPVGLRARGWSQACLITSMSSWTLHPCKKPWVYSGPWGISVTPRHNYHVSLGYSVQSIGNSWGLCCKKCFYSADWMCVLHTQRCGRRTWEALWRAVSSGVAEDGGRQMCYHLTTMPFGSGPWGELTHYFLQHVHYHVLMPLLHPSAAPIAFPGVAPATLPCLCHCHQWSRQQRTHRHTPDTQGSPQLSAVRAGAMGLLGTTNLTSGLCCWHSE